MMVKQINRLAGNYATQPSRMVSGGIRYAQIVPQAAVNIPKPSIIKIEKEFPFDSEIYAPSTGSYARMKKLDYSSFKLASTYLFLAHNYSQLAYKPTTFTEPVEDVQRQWAGYSASYASQYFPFLRNSNVAKSIAKICPEVATESLAERFEELKEKWQKETSFHSSLGEKFTNDSYISIIGMGVFALPFILNDLVENPAHWFYALEKIVGRDMAEGAKNYAEARLKWLSWGREHDIV
jgi:hypothetical protein